MIPMNTQEDLLAEFSDMGAPVDDHSVRQDATRLPDGTVTFLMTDVEGSTRLWEAGEDEANSAITRHYQLLHRAIALHRGFLPLEQGEGDSVVGVFAAASDALEAAVDVMRGLDEESWPTSSPVRVRMALHTGEAHLRDGAN